jgi:hypothetical protein
MTNSVVATLFDRSHTLKEKPEKIQKAYEQWIAQQAPAVRHERSHAGSTWEFGLVKKEAHLCHSSSRSLARGRTFRWKASFLACLAASRERSWGRSWAR